MQKEQNSPPFYKKITTSWQIWWRKQTPKRQDKFALFAPLTAVVLFLCAILAAFTYLRFEEMQREQESVRSDVEYSQQRIRLRILESQERAMRIADEINKGPLDSEEIKKLCESIIREFPEINTLEWIDSYKSVKQSIVSSNIASSSVEGYKELVLGKKLTNLESVKTFLLSKDIHQPLYSEPFDVKSVEQASDSNKNLAMLYPVVELYIPLYKSDKFAGALMSQIDLDAILRYSVPAEVSSRNAVSIVRPNGQFIAGQQASKPKTLLPQILWSSPAYETSVPITPFANTLELRAINYRTSQGLIGNGLIRLVAILSLLTAWMLLGTWRHTRKRLQAQEALIAETNFRRAMENSMLTGMRAMDLNGRITYVNAAFCQMTGWSEEELVGGTPPFPYWPKEHEQSLSVMLSNELKGLTPPGGYQIKVQHRNGKLFDARLYVSPLVDAYGIQTGWMTSMTDITEPNRIREQLSASHERFTAVLEGLDASVSVTPLGSEELLFANKLYRQWFSNDSVGHLMMVYRAGMPSAQTGGEGDSVDNLAGFPSLNLAEATSEHAEIYDLELEKWLEVRARYLNWVDGRLAQMVIATDITARRRAQEQAKIQEERAQASSRLITMGEMASSVAHELNQPLSAISNYCTGMMTRVRNKQITESDLLMALDKTSKQAHRAGQIIQRIRSFVKRSEHTQVPSDVMLTTLEAIELAEIEIKRRRVKFNHYFGPDLPNVKMDRILIQQVLINLLKNAAESVDHVRTHSEERWINLSVDAVQVEGQNVVEFKVKDSGGGLAPEVLEHLFEAFFSTKTEGLGIGLNLCRSIVESHQGRMMARNLYNGESIVGCLFSFWLPAISSKADIEELQSSTDLQTERIFTSETRSYS